MNINDLSLAIKLFLEDTRAERERLSALERATRKVADSARKLDKSIDKLIELQKNDEEEKKW